MIGAAKTDRGTRPPEVARAIAATKGWAYRDGEDICRECVEKEATGRHEVAHESGMLILPESLPMEEEQRIRRMVADLQMLFDRHAYVIQHGAGSGILCDGEHLRLLRDAIRYTQKRIVVFCEERLISLPGVATDPVPSEYPVNYCVQCKPRHYPGNLKSK